MLLRCGLVATLARSEDTIMTIDTTNEHGRTPGQQAAWEGCLQALAQATVTRGYTALTDEEWIALAIEQDWHPVKLARILKINGAMLAAYERLSKPAPAAPAPICHSIDNQDFTLYPDGSLDIGGLPNPQRMIRLHPDAVWTLMTFFDIPRIASVIERAARQREQQSARDDQSNDEQIVRMIPAVAELLRLQGRGRDGS